MAYVNAKISLDHRELKTYERYVVASNNLREACEAEGVPTDRLALMSEDTRRLWREYMLASNDWESDGLRR